MQQDIEGRIVAYIDELINQDGLSEIDGDELFILIDSIEGNLPERFISLAHSIDGAFEHWENFDLQVVLSRLLRILEVSKSLPKATTAAENDLAYFQITQAEKDAITMLASDMRKIISTSTQFDRPHKVRLLKRISAIEEEVQKEKGMFDVILGGINDIGETAGKFGDDVKPLVERMAEIEQITRGKSPDYAQLEKPAELLKLDDKTDDGDND